MRHSILLLLALTSTLAACATARPIEHPAVVTVSSANTQAPIAVAPPIQRSAWQRFASKTTTSFDGLSGYPCKAFDFAVLPTASEQGWNDVTEGASLGFADSSALCAAPGQAPYSVGEFRYFRTTVFVPEGVPARDVTVVANGIDDSLAVYVVNSRYASGTKVSCGGNGSIAADVASYLVPGANAIVVAHADLNCALSGLGSLDVTSEGLPLVARASRGPGDGEVFVAH